MRFTCLILFCWPMQLMAQSEKPQLANVDPMSSSYMIQLTAGLIAVVALIFLIAWILKRFNFSQQAHSGVLRVIAGLPLGTRDRLVLLQVGEEQILLGLSPGRIEKLHTLSEPVPVEASGAMASPFGRKINDLMKKEAKE